MNTEEHPEPALCEHAHPTILEAVRFFFTTLLRFNGRSSMASSLCQASLFLNHMLTSIF